MITLRPLTDVDLEQVDEWLDAPHVRRWWVEDKASQYLPVLSGEDPMHVLIAIHEERQVGLGQWYRWDDEPSRTVYGIPEGAAGIDYLIGHAHDCERGLGTALVAALVEAAAPCPVWVPVEESNEPSRRVLEKNGFELMAVKACELPEEPWAGPQAIYRLQR
ncbi:MAG: acetyltransferase [Frankiales bacterium]|nr:acetyltransferase [Frankiales bacterium]